ncbi:hypothetical protein [Micromonospora maritima]|uniref:hypothetical protein n=1 Tax=Micromonospora maritima TaxID=986711 RepID=UPI00157C6B4F|nr:hypothetical protein [Micromonospora maritima]
MDKRCAAVALSLPLAILLAACSSSATPEEQADYLRRMAQRGADLHAVKQSQGRGTPGDREECLGAYQHLYGGRNSPEVPHVGTDGADAALAEEGEDLFVESCVNGTPAPVPAR